MERTIKFADLEAAVAQAFEDNKSIKEGEADPRVKDENAGQFGIAVGLTDGSLIVKGDTDSDFALGSISRIPVVAQLLSQMSAQELLKKAGACNCACKSKAKKPEVPLPAKFVRAVSAVEPANDPEGKYDILLNLLQSMTVDAPAFDDKAYKAQLALNKEANIEDVLSQDGFYLYDETGISVDVASKLQSLKLTARQLATVGATLAADGVNPVTNVPAFDGAITKNILGMMAAKGLRKMSAPWMITVGVPAIAGFGGGVLAVVPGVMSVAAFAPELNEKGVSVKAAKAVAQILKKLDINALASARVKVEK